MEYVGICNQINEITNNETIIGASLEIKDIGEIQEIREDVQVEKITGVSIWGNVKDNCNQPIAHQVVKLLQKCESDEGEYFKVVSCTLTDEKGDYQLDAYGREQDRYQVIIERPETVPIQELTHSNDMINTPEINTPDRSEMIYPCNHGYKTCAQQVYNYQIGMKPQRSMSTNTNTRFCGANTHLYSK